ncbi:hypothetical protein DL762_010431 [Monosporascus cannonballus]|uniref:RRM domain-containing protein n=1 Tax=Monosporascus cannonballus TaxID=155416 RepID=A0ABY0GQ75_9PEZI|nr:hypothetical protein DL762_010431 [Monosporascus cannonballus]
MGSKRRRTQPAEPTVPSEAQTQDGEPGTDHEHGHDQGQDHGHPAKKARVEASRTLFVRSLPPTATADSLTEFFSQHFPVKHATVILDPKTKTSRGYGFVTFTDADDAKDAKDKLQKEKFDGRPLLLEIAEHRHRQGAAVVEAVAKKQERQAALAEARKAPKLIVRNLPWSIKTSDQLAALFRSYGKVKFADLPQSKGKLAGFGFVTIRGRKNAQNAMDSVNGKVVDGRTLAVDWAVDKKQWDQLQQKDTKAAETSQTSQGKEDDTSSEEDDDQGEKEKDDEDDMDDDLKNFMENHMHNMEDEDSNAEDDTDGESDGAQEAGQNGAPSAPAKPLNTDNSSTLFIRNLPFTTTDEQLKSHFEQFGRIRYARVVIDRATDRPTGTGFVCFATESDSKACLKGAPRPRQLPVSTKKPSILQDEMADPEGKYTIEGRILQVSQAVSKDEATRLAETGAAAREGRDKDKRRLYLLSEGTVTQNSPLYNMLSPAEVKTREDSAAQRKKLIQTNPSLHLSLTRLAVRNIPRDVDSKALKQLARQAIVEFAKDAKEGRRQPLSQEEKTRGGEEDREAERRRKEKGKGVVKQAKVVFENRQGSKVPEGDAAGRSRGYGFIEYTSHRWALMGLRWLNGHALKSASSGKTQRLIVEFAIENAQVVNRRREQQEKARTRKQEQDEEEEQASDEEEGEGTGNRKGKGKSLLKGKDFAVSKGKRQTRKGNRRGDAEDKSEGNNGESEGGSAQGSLKQKIIARKRMVRKKKVQARRS